MAESHPRGGGRRFKGNRRFVGGKISAQLADQLLQAAEIEGCTITDILESAIAMRMQHVDLTRRNNREVMPIEIAS